MNTHTHKDKNYKLKCLKLTIYDCSSKSFKLQSKFYYARVIFPCSYAVYMYKIMICKLLLNTFSSEISWQISTKFHVDPTVEMGLRVCSNGHTPLTVMPIYGKVMIIKKTHSSSKPRTAQMMILSLVAVIALEKCCITSAYLQWHFHSGERAVAHRPHELLLTIKARRRFHTLETAPELYFCQNKKRKFLFLNLNKVFKSIVWMCFISCYSFYQITRTSILLITQS